MLTECAGLTWAKTAARLLPGLAELARQPETEGLMRQTESRDTYREAAAKLVKELDRVAREACGADADEEVWRLFMLLRRYPAHWVAREVMNLREAASMDLLEAALEERRDLAERERARDRLLQALRCGVSELLGLEEQPLPDPAWGPEPGDPEPEGRAALARRLRGRLGGTE